MTERVSSYSGTGPVVVSPHHLATEAGLQAMHAGGTAADAVVAVNAVLGMVLPSTCGIGGDLFALVHKPGMDRPDVLNASGRGGSGLDAAALRRAGHATMPLYHPAAISVPGAVDGWEALLDRHGRRGLDEALAPAIELGESGFPVSIELADALRRLSDDLAHQPSARALYADGHAPDAGTVIRRPDLTRTLRSIADHGRSALYEGPVAQAIARATEGIVELDDLMADAADWVEPLGIDTLGLTGWSVPPNSQGYLTLAAAWIFERTAPPSGPDDAAFHHAAIEAYRAFAWERNDLVADPDHAPLSHDELLSPERLSKRLSTVRPDAVAQWPEPSPGPGGTAYFCAIDAEGMAVSCIQSNYFGIGSRISAGETGIFLHNRAAGFSLVEGHPNEAAPGKRPLHTLSPTLWTRGSEPALVLGTRGGDQQPQYLVQMAAAILHAGIDPTVAQGLPRWSISSTRPGGESAVAVETGMPEEVVTGLRDAGHRVVPGPPRTPGWGPVSVITIDATGRRRGAADPRVSTASASGG